jgi:hypothetical protein
VSVETIGSAGVFTTAYIASTAIRAAARSFVFAACVAALLTIGADATRADPSQSTVVVRLTSATVEAAPVNVLAGPLVFKIANKGKVARDFAIGGKQTPQIAAGRSTTLTVNLTKGFHTYSSIRRDHRGRVRGLLNALEPCTNPVSTTVTVQMHQSPGAITVSQSKVPCGDVTFLITNTGPMVDDLHVFAELPQEKGASPELSPGQTASLSIRFVAKGIAHYESGDFPPVELEYGGDGEQGQLAII